MQDTIPDAVLNQAADWLLELEAVPADSARHADFERWMSADPRHADAWRQVQTAWNRIGELPPVHASRWQSRAPESGEPLHPQSLNVRDRARNKLRRARWVGMALVASLVVLASPLLILNIQADIATSAAEMRNIVLDDGSRLTLAPKSAVALDYSQDRRRVRLIKGEAFFDVVADRERPFVVDARGAEITVVGTAFDVRVNDEQIAVDVEKGQVDVRYAHDRSPLQARLSPGEGLTVARQTGAAVYRTQDRQNVAQWREGRLFVDGVTLGEVVERLGAYKKGWILISDPDLSARRVTGLFDLRNPDAALHALVEPHGAVVRNITPLLSIISPP